MKYLYQLLIELSNNYILSLLLKKFSASRISRLIISSYVKVYKLNLNEMEKSLDEYRSLHELFIRKLKPGARLIHNEPIVSPVDAVIEEFGKISKDKTFMVKDKDYSLYDLFGENNACERYVDGTFFVLYLSPGHYHRIHSPVSGTVIKRWTLGKRSYPVNHFGLRYGKSPLSKNFRMITEITTEFGRLAMIKVGAMFVNSIELTKMKDEIEKGEELAYFSFGSTVLLLFEKETIQISDHISKGKELQVGETIGKWKGTNSL